MLSAVDTNVTSALWSNEPAASGMRELLFSARGEGGLIICAPVYAELIAYPGATKVFVDTFLADTRLELDVDLSREIWGRAGETFSAYAQRRREDKAGHPKRLLVDFVVGAHALLVADRLLTLDPRRYRTAYPKLTILPQA